MLTDSELKHLKPKEKPYKVTDRDGMYVLVSCGGTISFRLDYRLNGRRETVNFGRYAPSGLSLALARERCIDAKRLIERGQSPALEKQRAKRRIKEAKSFGQFGEKWLASAPMADSTRAMRRSIFEREMLPFWKNRLLTEITPGDLRNHCLRIVDRGAPATAIHVRDILKQIYGFANLHGEKVANPADEVGPASIATFVPKDRSLSPSEIRVLFKVIEKVPTLPTIRLGMKFFLLSMVRKSELQDAVWDEVDFESAVWSIPAERMKRSRAHNVYLSTQMLDILIALKTCAGSSRYLLPSRYDADAPMSRATFNRVTYAIAALRILAGARRFRARIVEKGSGTTVRTYQIAIGNGRLYGGGNVIEENAAIDDGTLDLYSLEMRNLWKSALMARAFRTGTHGAWKEVRTAQCVEFDIETRRPMPINTDGEIVTATPAHFRVLPAAVTVFAPPDAATNSRAVRLYHS